MSFFQKQSLNCHQYVYLSVVILCVLALLTSAMVINKLWQLPISQLFLPSYQLSLAGMAIQLKILPTMLVAFLAGGLLGLSSILLQQLVKNNLASDTTLSVSSGSQLALLMVTLFFPNFGLYGSFWVAFIGAMLSMGLVFFIAKTSKMNSIVLVLSGLVVNILWTAMAGVLMLFFSERTLGVMAWGSAILIQTSWQPSQQLSLVAVAFSLVLVGLYKPLLLMSLDDRQAQSLGVPVNTIRLLVILLVAIAIAMVVSHLGYVGFIGLAGATIVNMLSIHQLYHRFLLSFIIGGLLLWITSNVSALLSLFTSFNIPEGSMTAVLGTPLIIWLILKSKQQLHDDNHQEMTVIRKKLNFVYYGVALLGLFSFALMFAPNVYQTGAIANIQFGLVGLEKWALVLEFRLPRTLGAMAVGAMLAIAGVLLQTLSRNPMASPEVLGVGSGVSFGVVLAFMILPMFNIVPSMAYLAGFGCLGAVLVLALVLWLSQRVASTHLLLVGVAISALMGGVLNLIKLVGDTRLQSVFLFLSGSTTNIHLTTAIVLSMVAIVSLLLSLLLVKPLTLMSLGRTIAIGRGVAFNQVQLFILSIIAVLSMASTLAVGPLSFIGLITPHLATSLGATHLAQKLPLSAMLGAMLLVVADWIGRYVIFPYEIPAGTISAVIGASYFIYLMKKMNTSS